MKLIITGFGPFGSIADNPSRIIAKEVVEDLKRQGYDSEFVDLRVSMKDVAAFYENLQKDDVFVIHIGLYEGLKIQHLEQIGVNNATFSIPDADGAQPQNEQIVTNYPLNYEFVNSLPIDEWAEVLSNYFLKSTFAGLYVCNYTIVRGLNNVNVKTRGCIFVHCGLFDDIPKAIQVAGVEKLAHLIISHFS